MTSPASGPELTVSAVVCTFDLARWEQLQAATDSLLGQSRRPDELIVVVDHNPALAARVQDQVRGARVLENAGPQGLSSAKNTAVRAAQGDVLVFLDDDAVARPDWLGQLLDCLQDSRVAGVGGRSTPAWADRQPPWFPDTFLWVVGCTHDGSPDQRSVVRNALGGCTAIRRSVFDRAGLYRSDLGRIGRGHAGCEETEFCIRASRATSMHFLVEPTAEILHAVPHERSTLQYFVRRCYAEGTSKALLARVSGQSQGLSSERNHLMRVLPHAMLADLKQGFRGDPQAFSRIMTMCAGVGASVLGFVTGTIRLRLQRQPLSPRY